MIEKPVKTEQLDTHQQTVHPAIGHVLLDLSYRRHSRALERINHKQGKPSLWYNSLDSTGITFSITSAIISTSAHRKLVMFSLSTEHPMVDQTQLLPDIVPMSRWNEDGDPW